MGDARAGIRLAIIGCGAITERFHLPAAKSAGFEVVALVDPDTERARRLAAAHEVAEALSDVAELRSAIDAAIVAAPSALHAPIARDLVRRGVHCLVEKPLATTTADATVLIAAAHEAGVQLHAGLMHRYFEQNRLVHDLVATGALGEIRRFSVELGMVEEWSPVSAYAVERSLSGGGVLIDLGSHLLDLLSWWLGPMRVVSCRDDQRGGVEAECLLHLEAGTVRAVPGTVAISRLRTLRNTARVEGEVLTLETDVGPGALRMEVAGRRYESVDTALPPQRYKDAFVLQLEAFAAALRGEAPAFVPAAVALPTIELIEACYAVRRPLHCTWEARL